MSSYAGSRHGSRENLDDDDEKVQPRPQPRPAPVPQSRDRSYNRQYVRNEPAPKAESSGAPPSYRQYADVSRAAPVDRYGERPSARSHSPGRNEEERPQDQYFPSRSHSPSSYAGRGEAGRYDEKPPSRQATRPERSYSPARTLEPGYPQPHSGYSPSSQAGYSPAQGAYAPSHSGYAASQSGYAPSQSGYAPSQSGYSPSQRAYSPARGAPSQGYYDRSRGPSTASGYQPTYQPGGRGPSQSSQQYTSRAPPRSYNGYQQFGRGGYATRQSKPKHKSVTRDGGYYNVYTDAVVKTKRMRNKGVPTTYLSVTRPWSKNHSNQPRDFMPLVIASVFFNPVIGMVALVLSCFTKKAVTDENWAKAGLYGRITFWMSIIAILTGIIFFAVLIGSIHNGFVPPMRH